MVVGAPLEDARHLAQRYARMRQEAEAQVYAVSAVSFQCLLHWVFMLHGDRIYTEWTSSFSFTVACSIYFCPVWSFGF